MKATATYIGVRTQLKRMIRDHRFEWHLNKKRIPKRTWTAISMSKYAWRRRKWRDRNLLCAHSRGNPEERFEPNDRSGNNFHTRDVTYAFIPFPRLSSRWLHRSVHLLRNSHSRQANATWESGSIFFRDSSPGHLQRNRLSYFPTS